MFGRSRGSWTRKPAIRAALAIAGKGELCQGLEVDHALEPRIGSWFQRVFARKAVSNYAAEAEQGLRLALISERQAEVDLKQSQALAALIESLHGVESAALCVGSLLVIKDAGRVVSRSLTPVETAAYSRMAGVDADPWAILAELEKVARAEREVGPATR